MQVSLEQMKSTDLSTVDGVFQVSVLQNSWYTNMYCEVLMMPW